MGAVYEPLMFVDTLNNAKVTPMLATASSWSDANKVLTFTIRKGVTWTDGQPFSAADVAYTFNLLKDNPALDLNTVWSVLSSVVQKGDDVVMTFKTAAVPYFYYIADQVGIVPQHIWSKVGNPVTYKDANPVGTGPCTVKDCTPQNVSYVRNNHYWQPGLPKIAQIEYPAFTSNPPANTLLSTGGAQWGGQFIPNLKAEYLSKSNDNHFWFPPVVNVSIFINQTVPLLNNLAVRRAMAFAIDRSRVAKIGEYGYEPAANQAGSHYAHVPAVVGHSALEELRVQLRPAKSNLHPGEGRVQARLRRRVRLAPGQTPFILHHQPDRLHRLGGRAPGGVPGAVLRWHPADRREPRRDRLRRRSLRR